MGKTKIVINLHLKVDTVPQLLKALRKLENREVVVGFPEDKNVPRKDEEDLTNAEIGYLAAKGSPANNQPPREFLESGVIDAKIAIVDQLRNAGKNALDGNSEGVEKGLVAAGVVAVSAVRNKIVTGPFAPLAKSTIAARRRKGFQGTKPLNVTGQLGNAVNSTVRNRK